MAERHLDKVNVAGSTPAVPTTLEGNMLEIKSVLKSIYRSSRPKNIEDLKQISDLGITVVVCLEEGWTWLLGGWRAEKDFEKMGGNYLRIPFSNFFAPSIDLTRIVAEKIENSQGGVLIHCRAGVDRTGWMSGYLLYRCGVMDAQQAWDYIGKNGMHMWYRYLWKKSFFELCNS